MHQLELLYKYNYDSRERFNEKLFARDDDDIVNEVMNVIHSCQRDKFFVIKVKNYKVIEDPIEIHRILHKNEQDHIDSKKKKKKKENIYDFINMKDSDIKLLIVTYYVAAGHESDIFDTLIIIPRVINKYYFKLMGVIYTSKYQIVDGSTYNNTRSKRKKDRVVLKVIFGPINVYRNQSKLKDINMNKNIPLTLYTANVFSKTLMALKFILAKYGLNGAIKFCELSNIFISNQNPENEDWYTFNKNDIYVSVPKFIFDSDIMTQSFVCTVVKSINKDVMYNDIFNNEYWLCSLGQDYGKFSVYKGESVCESFEGIYDISTRNSIFLPWEHKATVYRIYRWMLREFSNLMIKDNLMISTKRVRFAEYVASIYAMKISRGIHRISDLGTKAKLTHLKKVLITNPTYLIYSLTKSTLINSRTDINDNDGYNPLKVTFKGRSGIGEGKKPTISKGARQIEPDYMGRIGLVESSSNDPGLSGLLCPYAKLHRDSFSKDEEPLTWEEDYAQLIKDYRDLTNKKEVLIFKKKMTDIYDETLDDIISDSIETFRRLMTPIDFIINGMEGFSPIEIIREDDDSE